MDLCELSDEQWGEAHYTATVVIAEPHTHKQYPLWFNLTREERNHAIKAGRVMRRLLANMAKR